MKIIDSVAAVFCNGHKIFTVRRQSYLKAFPGYDSFPGGKIDREDSRAQHPVKFLCNWDGHAMHALVREVQEELDYDLPAEIASGQIVSVKYLATALAPATVAIRFRLHFFRIDLKTRPVFSVDAGEIADSCWKTPMQLLDSFHKGDALMVPPLYWLLEKLHRDPQGDNFGDLSPRFDENIYVPRIEVLSGVQMLSIPSNTFPPEKRTNAFLLGDKGSPQILVDPSPASPQVLEKLRHTLRRDTIDSLFITHHHPDHYENAPELARHLSIPIKMSEDTRCRITQQQGNDYFSGLQIEVMQEGTRLTDWKGEAVRVYSIPGHDAGHLGLAPESLRWFLVGDLIQSAGTVVIAVPEGDMAVYFQTLKQIITLDPAVIIPSHGMPSRSTYRLQETLNHRQNREKEILELFLNGKTPAEILDIIYPEINQHLRPFARLNIESHLTKLRQDGQLMQ